MPVMDPAGAGLDGGGGVSLAHSLACSCLDCLIRRLRDELRAETPMRLHARGVGGQRSTKRGSEEDDGSGPRSTGGTWQPTVGPGYGTRVGLPFTPAMERYLNHPDHWGTSRLGMSSIIEVSEACAARHPHHRRPLFTRSLCGDLVFKAGYLGQSVDDIAWITGFSREKVMGLLTWGLRHAAQWRTDQFYRMTKVPGTAQPYPERKRVA
jgi:hypothetical protein